MSPPPFRWIDTPDGFAALCRDLAREPRLALDTESDGFHHYFDKLCLLQISTGSAHFIVDALAVGPLEPLRPVLENPGITTVLHAAEQDLMYLRRDHKMSVAGLFDTYLAGQLAGHARLGLASLLDEYFGVKMSKASQRDDWSRRPLTRTQLAYAITDTCHLLELAALLRRELEQKGRLAWAEEEFREQERREWIPEELDPDDLTRIKGWKDLKPRGRAILRELLRARDQEARRLDRPPFRVAGNVLLLELAAEPPSGAPDILKRKGLPRRGAEKLARLLMQAVERGQQMDEADFPGDPRRRGRGGPRQVRDPAFEERVNRLKDWRRQKAKELDLEPGVVAPQRDLELLAENPPGSDTEAAAREAIRHWRWQNFAGEWKKVLAAASTAG